MQCFIIENRNELGARLARNERAKTFEHFNLQLKTNRAECVAEKRFKKWTSSNTSTSSTLSSAPSTQQLSLWLCTEVMLHSMLALLLLPFIQRCSHRLRSTRSAHSLSTPAQLLYFCRRICVTVLRSLASEIENNSGKWSLLIGRLCCVFARNLILFCMFFFLSFRFALATWCFQTCNTPTNYICYV